MGEIPQSPPPHERQMWPDGVTKYVEYLEGAIGEFSRQADGGGVDADQIRAMPDWPPDLQTPNALCRELRHQGYLIPVAVMLKAIKDAREPS